GSGGARALGEASGFGRRVLWEGGGVNERSLATPSDVHRPRTDDQRACFAAKRRSSACGGVVRSLSFLERGAPSRLGGRPSRYPRGSREHRMADATSDASAPERLVVEVQDSRDIGPVEADGLLRECLSLTHKRLDAAIWRVLQRLQGAAAEDEEDPVPSSAVAPPPRKLDDAIALAGHGKRAQFTPRFRAAFDQAL